jgi:2',3'-cyclic-nucleotide 2'-phosphodiesterase (5'-nucleotidase family)
MRTRSTLIAVVTAVLAAAVVVSSIVAGKSKNIVSSPQQKIIKQDPPGTISGAIDKNLIPDHAAYTIFLRFAAHQNQANKPVVRSYFKFNGFGDADIAAILAVAEDFRQRVAVLDSEVRQIKDRNWPNPDPSVMAQLSQLQQQKEAIVSELVNSLPTRLSSQGQERMNHLIKDRIKAKMKIFPPPPPPGGPGWNKKHH